MQYTLITGASMGIGKALAEECAKEGMNLLLVALPGPELDQVCQDLVARYGIQAHPFAIDLTLEDAPRKVYDWSQTNGYEVNILINNAGFGTGGLFENTPLATYIKMVRLNNQALVEMTYHFLPELKRHNNAHLLCLSSMEATLPLPYKAVYTGTKNFIYSFCLAIREELRPSTVRVSILCPGPVLTNPDGLKRIESQGGKGQILMTMPEKVAKIAVKKMLQNKAIIIPGALPIAIVRVLNLLPILWRMRILERVFRPYRDM